MKTINSPIRANWRMKNVDVKRVASIIKQGGLVVFPTETVYGLGADAFNPAAVRKIFKVKGRPESRALIVHIARFADLKKFAKNIPPLAIKLSKKYWPGPLTLVLKRRTVLQGVKGQSFGREALDIITGGGDTVAIRMPDHPLTLALIRLAGPIVGPSANFYGHQPPRSVKEILPKLLKQVDAVLDGGKTKLGVPSTIVDFTQKTPKVLRQGIIKID